jgi:hypothetical protein
LVSVRWWYRQLWLLRYICADLRLMICADLRLMNAVVMRHQGKLRL